MFSTFLGLKLGHLCVIKSHPNRSLESPSGVGRVMGYHRLPGAGEWQQDSSVRLSRALPEMQDAGLGGPLA